MAEQRPRRSQAKAGEEVAASAVTVRRLGNLADLAALGIASEPTLRKWIAAEPDQPWILRRGKNGIDYEIDLAGAVASWEERREAEVAEARARAEGIGQLRLQLGLTDNAVAEEFSLSLAERKQLFEEELLVNKLARERGELIAFAEAAAALGDILLMVRKKGETFAARLAKKIDLSREQIAAIDALIERDQAELADELEKVGEDLGEQGSGIVAPAASAAHTAVPVAL